MFSLWCEVCVAVRNVRPRFPLGSYRIVDCEACGFRFTTPLPKDAAYAEQGVGQNYAHYVKSREMKKEHFRRKFDHLGERLPRGRLLDVGCAAGFLLEVARERGFEVEGVEINPAFAHFTAPELNGKIRYQSSKAVRFDRPFEVITLFDVLEHSPHPREELLRCREWLAPGGVLVLQLPCVDSLSSRVMGRRWFHYAAPSHLSYFTHRTLKKLASTVGLTVSESGWTRKYLSVDYLVSQIALQLSGIDQPLHLPGIGGRGLMLPMGEALFLLQRT